MTRNVEIPNKGKEELLNLKSTRNAVLAVMTSRFLNKRSNVDEKLPEAELTMGLPKDLSPEEIENAERLIFAKRLVFGNLDLVMQTETAKQRQQKEIQKTLDEDENLLEDNLDRYVEQYGKPTLPGKTAEKLRQEAAQRAANKSKASLKNLREKTGKISAVVAAGAILAGQGGSDIQNQRLLQAPENFTQTIGNNWGQMEVSNYEQKLLNRLNELVPKFELRVAERLAEINKPPSEWNPYKSAFLKEVVSNKDAGLQFLGKIRREYQQILSKNYAVSTSEGIARLENLLETLEFLGDSSFISGANFGSFSLIMDKIMKLDPGMVFFMPVYNYQGLDSNQNSKLMEKYPDLRAPLAAVGYLGTDLPSSEDLQVARDIAELVEGSQNIIALSTGGRAVLKAMEQGLLHPGVNVICINLNTSAKGFFEQMENYPSNQFLIINAEVDHVLQIAELADIMITNTKVANHLILNPALAAAVSSTQFNKDYQLLGSLDPFDPKVKLPANARLYKYIGDHGVPFFEPEMLGKALNLMFRLNNNIASLQNLDPEISYVSRQPTKKIDAYWEFEAGKIIPKQDQFPKSNLAGSGNGFINSLHEE